jgi:hypothetical protein
LEENLEAGMAVAELELQINDGGYSFLFFVQRISYKTA